jgi:P-type Cu+ transporter
MKVETTHIVVGNMNCNSCAAQVTKYLQKKNLKEVQVNFATGDTYFLNEANLPIEEISNGLSAIGYPVKKEDEAVGGEEHDHSEAKKLFFYSLPFTLLLMCHMLPFEALHFLNNGYLQLALCLPVYVIGMWYFGKPAWASLKHGTANMNLLIVIGASAAFLYSVLGLFLNPSSGAHAHKYLFFETAATIVSFVLLGNWLEEVTGKKTQSALSTLIKKRTIKAQMIAFDDAHKEQLFEVEAKYLKSGDLIQINTGEEVPADCKILWGEAYVNESLLTGESIPLTKQKKDILIGGSIIQDGLVKAQVTHSVKDGTLQQIINVMLKAQSEKPPLQLFADKVSAIFVPAVIVIALLCFGINYFWFTNFTEALMRSIAVLVVACPCAMGLATPAAIAVGLGRALKEGVLFKNATVLEHIKKINKIIFDKTGTLTNGDFAVSEFYCNDNVSKDDFFAIVYSLEKYSKHPIAIALAKNFTTTNSINFKTVKEEKGKGVFASTENNDTYAALSFEAAKAFGAIENHNVFILKNEEIIGWINVKDSLRDEAKEVINNLQHKNVATEILSGDNEENVLALANEIGIKKYYASKLPLEKLHIIESENSQNSVAYVGDGINDGPALQKATIGISLHSASQLAITAADIILLKGGLQKLPFAIGIGKATQSTIISNLFWALFYNVIFIPVAAVGLLHPTWAALIMAGSDVVLVINSLRLKYIKIK